MAHVDNDQLYTIFHALTRPHRGETPIDGMEVGEELAKILKRVSRDRFREPPAAEHAMDPDAIRKSVAHGQKCQKCQILVYEAGPYAKRLPSRQELAEEEQRQAEEAGRLTVRFFVVAVLGVASFIGAHFAIVAYRDLGRENTVADGAVLRGVDTGFHFHPLQLLFVALILAAAFCIADAWRIATSLWLDFTKAKEAVPFVGKRWAARSRKKQGGR